MYQIKVMKYYNSEDFISYYLLFKKILLILLIQNVIIVELRFYHNIINYKKTVNVNELIVKELGLVKLNYLILFPKNIMQMFLYLKYNLFC